MQPSAGRSLDEDLRIEFQPIFEVVPEGRRLYAFECLTRGLKGSALESAEMLFREVRRQCMEEVMDRACLSAALREASTLGGTARLCINIHGKTLSTDADFLADFSRITEEHDVPPARLTLEIVEHSDSWATALFHRNLEALRQLGVSLSIDDFGIGYSNLHRLLECRPDYCKIERYFVAGCDRDPRRIDILRAVSQLAHRFAARVIAEGVETAAELAVVNELGIELVQGFLLSPPLGAEQIRAGELLGQLALPSAHPQAQ
jgi:EAL domain-containing protein (putative c-di-GMP-specific phosphodiesterase class I)